MGDRGVARVDQREDRLHDSDPVLLGLETLVHLEERDDYLLLSEVFRRRNALDLSIHRVIEQDLSDYSFAREVAERARNGLAPKSCSEEAVFSKICN